MPPLRRILILGLCIAASGCANRSPSPEVAALRTNVDTASAEELANVVSSALGGRDVSLADDALTQSSVLIIERSRMRRIDRPPELGRDLGRPERFQLIRDANQCFLVHESTELRWLLVDTDCVPE